MNGTSPSPLLFLISFFLQISDDALTLRNKMFLFFFFAKLIAFLKGMYPRMFFIWACAETGAAEQNDVFIPKKWEKIFQERERGEKQF